MRIAFFLFGSLKESAKFEKPKQSTGGTTLSDSYAQRANQVSAVVTGVRLTLPFRQVADMR